MPVFRSYPEAIGLNATDALVLDRIGVGTMYVTASDVFLAGGSYSATFSFFGLPPNSNELMGAHFFPFAVSFAANMASPGALSGGACSTNPAANFSAAISHLSGGVTTSLGTMNISTAGVITFSTSAVDFIAGDSILFTGPSSADLQIQNIWWTILGGIAS